MKITKATALPLHLYLKYSSQHNDLHIMHSLKSPSFNKKRDWKPMSICLESSTQHLVEKVWCNESAAFINLNCKNNFTRGLPKKMNDFAHKRQFKPTSTIMEPSLLFHSLF